MKIRYLIASIFLGVLTVNAENTKTELATFAGGCFWCMQSEFDEVPGVIRSTVGYTGGHVKNPTYEQVSSGTTGHLESMEVEFDPSKLAYEKLLEIFWDNVDPTDPGGQFVDRGTEYKTAIFYHGEAQRAAADKSKEELAKRRKYTKPIATEIRAAEEFYPAEDYHQQYYKKNPTRYHMYRVGSGRDAALRAQKALEGK